MFLVYKIVVHDPLVPELASRIHVQLHPCPHGRCRDRARRSWIEGVPPHAGEVDLYPCMGVLSSNDEVSRQLIPFAATEPGHEARRNSQLAKHHRHCGSEVLTMSGL